MTATIFTQKFEKDILKFVGWANENNYDLVKKPTGENVKWDMSVFAGIAEPGRNKLEKTLSEVLKNYNITIPNVETQIEQDEGDAKIIIKLYTDSKTTQPKQRKSKSKSTSDTESSIDTNETIKNETAKVKKPRQKRISKTKTQDQKDQIEISETESVTQDTQIKQRIEKIGGFMDIDRCGTIVITDGTYYLDTLNCSTEQLVGLLGDPLKTGTQSSKHRYEWKFMINNEIFTIYDWVNEDGVFDDFAETEWYIGGEAPNKRLVTRIKEFLDARALLARLRIECAESAESAESTESEKSFSTSSSDNSSDSEALFGADSEHSDTDIELDDIDLEI